MDEIHIHKELSGKKRIMMRASELFLPCSLSKPKVLIYNFPFRLIIALKILFWNFINWHFKRLNSKTSLVVTKIEEGSVIRI